MSGENIVENWRLIAQAIGALANHIDGAVGSQLVPVTFANLPPAPQAGMVCAISDSTVIAFGSVAAGGGTHTVMVWYNGANWTVTGQ